VSARDAWKADPLRPRLRELRGLRQLSLTGAAEKSGLAAVVIGSYERGERRPTPEVLRRLLGAYGYELAIVPAGAAVPVGVVEALRALADDFERREMAA
jgi:transcriptional regulator with XRE-family HTH domain